MGPSWRRNYLRYKTYFLSTITHYKERRDLKMYLELLLSLATVSVFAVFALRPTLITIAELSKEIDTKRQTADRLDEKIRNLSTAQTVFEQEREKILLLDTSIPKEPSPDLFVRQIEALSGQKGATILSMSLGEATILGDQTPKRTAVKLAPLPGEANELSFSVNVTSNYPTLSSFLAGIETLRRPLLVDGLNFVSTQVGEGRALVLVVSGRTPFLRNSKTAILK